MFVTVDGCKAWLVGDQPRWRRFMTREMTRRGLLGWGIASVAAFILTYVLLGNDEATVERIFVSLMVSLFIGMILMIWVSIKNQVKPGAPEKLVYELTTPIWNLVMVPSVVKRADSWFLKILIDDVFYCWQEKLDQISKFYPHWLLFERMDDANDQFFGRLLRVAEYARANDEMAEQYDHLLDTQLIGAQAAIEEKLVAADNEYIALEQEWNRLQAIRTST